MNIIDARLKVIEDKKSEEKAAADLKKDVPPDLEIIDMINRHKPPTAEGERP